MRAHGAGRPLYFYAGSARPLTPSVATATPRLAVLARGVSVSTDAAQWQHLEGMHTDLRTGHLTVSKRSNDSMARRQHQYTPLARCFFRSINWIHAVFFFVQYFKSALSIAAEKFQSVVTEGFLSLSLLPIPRAVLALDL